MSRRTVSVLLLSCGAICIALFFAALQWMTFWHGFPRADGDSYAEVHPLRWRVLVGGIGLGALLTCLGVAMRCKAGVPSEGDV